LRFVFWLLCLLLVLDSLLRFVLLCLRALGLERADSAEATAAGRCVVLIAAKDEAGTIGPTVAALGPQLAEWPGSSLWVVADRCEDDTAREAGAAGAGVAVRAEGRLGKGAVIAWWMQNYKDAWRSQDTILVVDADSRLLPGSLRALKGAIEKRNDAAQAFVMPEASTRSGRLAGWSEILMQRIDDEARCRNGWQIPLRGTGMALRAELLAELAPKLHTLAEDLELDIMLAARGAKVVFVSDAVIVDPKPQHSAGAARQRARWLRGQLQVLRGYTSEIFRALTAGGVGAWFLLPLLFLRPRTLFIGLRLLTVGTGMLVTFTRLSVAPTFNLMLWSALVGLALDTFYYLAAIKLVDNRREYVLDLLAAPRYALMWLYSLGLLLIRRGWLRAGRSNTSP